MSLRKSRFRWWRQSRCPRGVRSPLCLRKPGKRRIRVRKSTRFPKGSHQKYRNSPKRRRYSRARRMFLHRLPETILCSSKCRWRRRPKWRSLRARTSTNSGRSMTRFPGRSSERESATWWSWRWRIGTGRVIRTTSTATRLRALAEGRRWRRRKRTRPRQRGSSYSTRDCSCITARRRRCPYTSPTACMDSYTCSRRREIFPRWTGNTTWCRASFTTSRLRSWRTDGGRRWWSFRIQTRCARNRTSSSSTGASPP